MMCFSWNCQGAAAHGFMRILKDILHKHNPDIFGLLEPKVSGNQADRICKNIGYDHWVRVEAFGFSGGIWIFWRDNILVEIMATHPQFVLLRVADRKTQPWLLTFVYGSPSHQLRKKLWEDLRAQKLKVTGPWICLGDFNSVISEDEVNNSRSFSQQRCNDFINWIYEEGFMDLGFTGQTFTWSRRYQEDEWKGARLDRVLCNSEGRILFPEAKVEHLPRVGSDHCPILFCSNDNGRTRNVRPFRFQIAWFTHPGFGDEVKKSWDPCTNLAYNKEILVRNLKKWNISEFGNIFKKKNRLYARIAGIQRRMDNHTNKALFKLEAKLKKELDEVLKQEELHWYQKSRE